ncbi:hypothetical protein BaRGS_00038398, partial [Batillaria attramentaria]
GRSLNFTYDIMKQAVFILLLTCFTVYVASDNLFQETQDLVRQFLSLDPFLSSDDCATKCKANFDTLGGRDKATTDHACEVECKLLTFSG